MTSPDAANKIKAFQKSVLTCMVDWNGRGILDPDTIMSEGNIYLDRDNEDNELRIKLKFSSKSSHIPIVQFRQQDFTPDPNDMKRKTKIQNLLTVYNNKDKDSINSVLHGVFIALDYKNAK